MKLITMWLQIIRLTDQQLLAFFAPSSTYELCQLTLLNALNILDLPIGHWRRKWSIPKKNCRVIEWRSTFFACPRLKTTFTLFCKNQSNLQTPFSTLLSYLHSDIFVNLLLFTLNVFNKCHVTITFTMFKITFLNS